MRMMRLYLEGVGLLGPGLASWVAGRAVLGGEAFYSFAPTVLRAATMLPATERRRAGVPVKLALAVAEEAFSHAGRETGSAATVFTSSEGDCDNIHAINCILADKPAEMSPTRFHNSVHNSAAGYWCIAAGSREPSTSLCAYDASFAAGLLESATQVVVNEAVVALVAYDHAYPEPMSALRPIACAFGVALILAPCRTERSIAMLEIDFVSGPAVETMMPDAGLEALRVGVPAARALPLLEALAAGEPRQISLNYLDDNHLTIRVVPC
jgi:hypothetical protein